MSQTGMRRLIKEFGTQKQLADLLGLTQQQISKCVQQGYVPMAHAITLALVVKTPVTDYVHPNIVELIRLSRK